MGFQVGEGTMDSSRNYGPITIIGFCYPVASMTSVHEQDVWNDSLLHYKMQ